MADELFTPKHILTIVTNGIIILIGLIVTFLYIKCKALHTYPCYNKLAINLILLTNNILRVIPLAMFDESIGSFLKNAQASLVIFTDKFYLIILTNQIVIQYLGIMHTNFYFKKEKQIFIYGTILSAMISIALAGVFIKGGYKDKKEKNDKLYYYGNNDEDYKKIIDTVYNGLLLVINVISLIIIIINSSIRSKLAKSSGMGDSNYEHNFTQALIKFIVNAITYIIAFLIIYRVMSGYDLTDFVYLMGCLIVEIAYCFNRAVIKEICKLCFCKTYEEDKMDGPLLKTNTFGEEDLASNDSGDDD
jgi:hypothetical protein